MPNHIKSVDISNTIPLTTKPWNEVKHLPEFKKFIGIKPQIILTLCYQDGKELKLYYDCITYCGVQTETRRQILRKFQKYSKITEITYGRYCDYDYYDGSCGYGGCRVNYVDYSVTDNKLSIYTVDTLNIDTDVTITEYSNK